MASKTLHYCPPQVKRAPQFPVPAHRSESSPSQLAPAQSFLTSPSRPQRVPYAFCRLLLLLSARHANATPKSCHFARKSSREARTFSNRGLARVAAAGMRLRRVANRCCPDFQIETRTRARTPSARCRSARAPGVGLGDHTRCAPSGRQARDATPGYGTRLGC